MVMLLLMTTAMPLLAANERINSLRREIASVEAEIARLTALGDTIHVAELNAQLINLRAELAIEEARAAAGGPRLELLSPLNITIDPGESREVTLTFRNVGTHHLQSLFTLAAPSDNSPFTAEFLGNTNSVSRINSNAQRTMRLNISVDATASVGNHYITLNHFFQDHQQNIVTTSHRINVRVGGVYGTPNVRLGNFRAMPAGQLTSGQTFTVTANIENVGVATARDVRISLPQNMSREDHIFITSDLNQAIFPSMEPGHSSVLNFTFQVAHTAPTGAYTIAFNITFRDEAGQEYPPVVIPFVANVIGDDGYVPNLEIRDMSAPVGRISVGQTGTVSFYLVNSGEIEARNIRVEATPQTAPEDETAIVPMGTPNMQVIPSLAPGESRRLSFNFSPRDSAVTRSYAIRFRTAFELGRGGETITFDQFAAFNVYNPYDDEDAQAARRQIPRVIVSDSDVYPPIPRAGHEFEMTITFRNTNATRSVNNIRIEMAEVLGTTAPGQQAHSAGFSPVGGSNTLFIDYLAPHDELTKVLRFITSPEATSGVHTLRFSFQYQDDNFETHEDSEQISISIGQISRLELANVNVSEFASVDQPVWFSFRIINSGHVNLRSIRVRTEGPFDITDAGGTEGRFIGTINLQRFAEFDGRFTPLEPGAHQGVFIITGEDPTGEIVELRHTFYITVEDGFDFEGGDWPGAWEGDMDGRGRPSFNGGFGFEEEDESNAVVRFFRNIFTREVAPADWNEEFMGEFDPELAAMMGMGTERGVRWIGVLAVIGVFAAAIGIPVVIVLSKKRNALDFDDEE